jgi:hypothetical protein
MIDMNTALSTTDAVHTYLLPFVQDYEHNVCIHRAMCDRVDHLISKGLWGGDEGQEYKETHGRIARVNQEISRAEHALGLALGVLVALYGKDEAARLYPQLWSLVGVV